MALRVLVRVCAADCFFDVRQNKHGNPPNCNSSSRKNVKAILVNIFGGTMKCDIIANGVVDAAKEMGLTVPLVVRLEGTNVALGKKILSESGLKITAANDLADAAQKAVAAAKGAK